jgi:protein tyrosine phosphatase (PTP) superfamily phosphohydrolase (DUF442 family)
MGSLRSRLRANPNADPLIWPIPGELACAQRPLRDHPEFGESNPLPEQSFPLITNWIRRVRDSGIQSVICLLTPHQLQRYAGIHPDGLLGAYREAGLAVLHVPVFDEVHPNDISGCEVLGESVFSKAYKGFQELPKPVLLHCSAGIDRSSPVAAQIVTRAKKLLFARPTPEPV